MKHQRSLVNEYNLTHLSFRQLITSLFVCCLALRHYLPVHLHDIHITNDDPDETATNDDDGRKLVAFEITNDKDTTIIY